jgi:hypothetical protein
VGTSLAFYKAFLLNKSRATLIGLIIKLLGNLFFCVLEPYGWVRKNDLIDENQLLAVCAFKLIIYFRCVHNHHKEKNKSTFIIIFKRKSVIIVVKVNMVNHMLHVD